AARRVDLLREVVPRLARAAVLWRSTGASATADLRATQAAATAPAGALTPRETTSDSAIRGALTELGQLRPPGRVGLPPAGPPPRATARPLCEPPEAAPIVPVPRLRRRRRPPGVRRELGRRLPAGRGARRPDPARRETGGSGGPARRPPRARRQSARRPRAAG